MFNRKHKDFNISGPETREDYHRIQKHARLSQKRQRRNKRRRQRHADWTRYQPMYTYNNKRHHHWLRDSVISVVIIIIVAAGWLMLNNQKQTAKPNGDHQTSTSVSVPTHNSQPSEQQANDDRQAVSTEMQKIGVPSNEQSALMAKFAQQTPAKQVALYRKIQRMNDILPTNSLKLKYLQHKVAQYQQNQGINN